MNFNEIQEQLKAYQKRGLSLFVTSSFQTHSIVLLHIISRIDKSIPVYFLNTGFLFPETITYKDKIADLFGLQVIGIRSQVPRNMQKDSAGNLLFTSDPDHCCYINKIQPMEPLLKDYDIWINGVRADQNENRKKMNIEALTPQGCLRFHPMLDWTSKMIESYIKEYNLPRHPLESQGYLSIGCEPCTRKINLEVENDPRLSRWFGLNKTECGLHTDLISK